MEEIFNILLTTGVVIYLTYSLTKSGMVDDAIKYFKQEILKIK